MMAGGATRGGFDTLLIANRGEIAVRVARTARRLGYRVVGVASEADAAGMHARVLDALVVLPGVRSADTYLRVEAIVDAARRLGAGAVHPGYGFLAERAEFAEACAAAGLVFVGPSPTAIRAMGDKVAAKRRMIAAGVPTLPGALPIVSAEAEAWDELRAAAPEVGFPLLVKAAAGGGGRGIRVVREAAELDAALASAAAEAERLFGARGLMLERLVEGARHIEVQIFGDAHGQVVHLFERECSVQRRRQKVVEEAPSPVVDAALRARMGAAAVRAAEAIGYVGAGTVEFLLDSRGEFYFLEMNTRLQVEHPVTEAITGEDLVEWQLRVAAGEPLPRRQEELAIHGHAIEARLYAEDPARGFAPQSGAVEHFAPAASGIRVDAGVEAGDAVSTHYDAMIAKFVAHGASREAARRALRRGLMDAPLVGPVTNRAFLCRLLGESAFRDHAITTETLDGWEREAKSALFAELDPDPRAWTVAALALGGAPALGSLPRSLRVSCGERERTFALRPVGGMWQVWEEPGSAGPSESSESSESLAALHPGSGWRWLRLADERHRVFVAPSVPRAGEAEAVVVDIGDGALRRFSLASPYPRAARTRDPRRVLAPFAGTLLELRVAAGARVEAGDVVALIEAMKMETRVVAEGSGRVARVSATPGTSVTAGALLVELVLDEDANDDVESKGAGDE